MKNPKVKTFIKDNLKSFVIGGLIFTIIGVCAAVTFPSSEVSYDNSESGLSSTNLKGAIDELYKRCTANPALDVIEDLVSTNTNELYKDEHGDIRYYGPSPNNYVSFNNELWRIIGVIDGKIKIIRNESIENMQWNSTSSNNWNNASLKSYLNGDYYNSINETYKNMISEETYYLGGPTTYNYKTLTASDYYNVERDSTQVYSGNPASTTQYIGLMYPSDYGYAAGSSCLSTALLDYDGGCKNSDYLSIGVTELLQTPNADIGRYYTVILHGRGSVFAYDDVTGSYAGRPVLYLNTNVQITGGNGSQSNPYTLT